MGQDVEDYSCMSKPRCKSPLKKLFSYRALLHMAVAAQIAINCGCLTKKNRDIVSNAVNGSMSPVSCCQQK